MANVLPMEKQIAIISALAEGSGIRVESQHVESVPIKETFQCKTAWEGIVEVFDLIDHPKVTRLYAWADDTGNPTRPKHVTVLHSGSVNSPLMAVRV